MKHAKALLARQGATLILVSGSLFLAGFTAGAQNVEHLSITQPGGMPGLPVITGVERLTNGVRVRWDGPAGYYQVLQKQGLDAPWEQVDRYNRSRRLDITSMYSNAFFKIAGPSPNYAGSASCLECHESIHNSEMNTKHAGAFTNPQFVAFGGQNNPSCLPCHTVGYGLPTGFISASATPHLTGVQCENCHGPAGNHQASEFDPTFKPRVDIAANVCGGCHTDSHHPTFDEWKESGHGKVTEDMNAASRISGCGRCHSGSSRLALLKGKDPTVAVVGDANVAIGCVTCHDPHQKTANPAQLRNPMVSTNDYFLSTADVFATKYNPNINVCAQCHNHRGASWTSTSRPPHHSPQYNMLLGTVGEVPSGLPTYLPSAHALQVTNQCVGCHMQTAAIQNGPPVVPAVTGHSFKVDTYGACAVCHPSPQALANFAMFGILPNGQAIPGYGVSNQIQQVKGWLNQWATNKANATLKTKYGVRAWEYTTPGTLSNPNGASTPAGPSASDQALIPDKIKKARYNLYLVLHDGSYGVHNGAHAVNLLEAAKGWIQEELNK